MKSSLRLVVYAALAPFALVILAGCSPVVPLQPAEDATNPACAEIMVRLPDAIDGHVQRETNAQATAAWGAPDSTILLRCGVPVPAPSTLPCYTIKGVDWLRDGSDAPNYIFTTYGRDPAVEVIIDGDKASSSALTALGNPVGSLPAERKCLAADDVLGEQ